MGTERAVSTVADPARQAVSPEPHPRRWAILAVVSIGLLMISIDQTIVATALVAIQRDLGAELAWSGWTITVYSVGQIIAMPVAGRLSDQFGRKKVFLIAAGIFLLGSLGCGLANNIYVLIACRAVQALGGGAVLPAATGIVAAVFGANRDRAVGMFTSIFPVGAIIGPVLGGLLVGYLSWRAIFLVNLPIGVVLLVLGFVLITESVRQPGARVDAYGIGVLAVLMLSAMYGITSLGTGAGLADPRFLVAEVVAVVAGWLFVRNARRRESAIVPMSLLRGRGFATMHLINVFLGAAAIGFSALVPLYAELRFNLDPLASGSLLSVRAVGMISTAGLAVYLLRRTGHRVLMIAGVLTLVVGLVLMALPPDGVSGYAWLALAAGVTGLGMGITAPSSNNATMHLAPDHIAAITGLRGMFRQSGAILAVSVTTAVLARSDQPGITAAYSFGVFAALLLITIPLIRSIPDHRGRW